MIEISILRVLATRDGYEKMFSAIPLHTIQPKTKILIGYIRRYYELFPNRDKIEFVEFRDMFFQTYPNMAPEDKVLYDKVLRHVEANIEDVSREVLINSMLELGVAHKVAELLKQYNDGEELHLIHDLESITSNALQSMERKEADNWIMPDMDEIIDSFNVNAGLTWRQEGINELLRPLVGGDMVLVGGRPDTGKTTFITDAVTHMASQLDSRPILWLNNEGPGGRIVSRLVQSALGINTKRMQELHAKGTLRDDYAEAISGIDKIRVIDIHDYWNWQVEELIETHQPKLVVMDMIDNIQFAGVSMRDGARTDQILEQMYKWTRTQGVKHNCVMMATSQISADGEGIAYPSMDMLKDSKTGKQGALDLQIMIGKEEGNENSRFIGTPKNKLRMPGKFGYVKLEYLFDNEQARFVTQRSIPCTKVQPEELPTTLPPSDAGLPTQ